MVVGVDLEKKIPAEALNTQANFKQFFDVLRRNTVYVVSILKVVKIYTKKSGEGRLWSENGDEYRIRGWQLGDPSPSGKRKT